MKKSESMSISTPHFLEIFSLNVIDPFFYRYVAILPSIIPGYNRALYFKKGDIKDHANYTEWGRDILEKILPLGFQTASFYKIKNHRVLLTMKCFQQPIQFYEMFANTKRYVRKLKL